MRKSGEYDPGHHELIRYGTSSNDGQDYEGNTDLDAFAEIDLGIFLRALRFWSAASERVTSPMAPFNHIHWNNVKYCENDARSARYEISELESSGGELTEASYLASIFEKPAEFSVENEIRVAVGTMLPQLLTRGATPLFPSSSRLRKSIVRMGKA